MQLKIVAYDHMFLQKTTVRPITAIHFAKLIFKDVLHVMYESVKWMYKMIFKKNYIIHIIQKHNNIENIIFTNISLSPL